MNTVDKYFNSLKTWKEELSILRGIILNEGLEESLKWGRPCYTRNGKMIIGLSGFKNHYGMWFFHGCYLKDEHKILVNAQEGKTQAMRQLRMSSSKKLDNEVVKAYVKEAVLNADKGHFYKPEKKELVIPELLQQALSKDKELDKSFNALSLSRRREYAEYIGSAKREATKISRLEKINPKIKRGEGLHDKYR